MNLRSYTPGQTVSITVAATSSRVKLIDTSSPTQVRVMNDGTATVWLAFGGSTVAATASGLPVPAGAVEVLTIPQEATHVAAIAAGSSGIVYFTVGMGI